MREIRPVTVRGVSIGFGRPAIIVPLTAPSRDELLAQARALRGRPVDLVEWRIDGFAPELTAVADHADAVLAVAVELRGVLDEIAVGERATEAVSSLPLLLTFRTAAEGGERGISDGTYAELLGRACSERAADLVDVEMFRDEPTVRRIIAAASSAGIPVVGSNHHFDRTPSEDEIVDRLRRMQELGASIPKIAVMPSTPDDVLTLLRATWTMRSQHADRPIITMSMGPLGAVSRVAGGVFGSAATFGTVGAASAPGQIPVDRLLAAMDALS